MTMMRTGCRRCFGGRARAGRGASGLPSARPRVPRGPSVAAIALASSAVAPSSRRMEAAVSPFFTTTVRSFQVLPPVTCDDGFRQQADVLGNDAGLEAGIGVDVAFGRVGERASASRRLRADWFAPPTVQLAASRTRAITSSNGSAPAIFAPRHGGHEIAHRRRKFRHRRRRSAARPLRRAARRWRRGRHWRATRAGLNGGDIGGEFGGRERQVGGDADERAGAHDLALADLAGGRNPDHLAGRMGFARLLQLVGLPDRPGCARRWRPRRAAPRRAPASAANTASPSSAA